MIDFRARRSPGGFSTEETDIVLRHGALGPRPGAASHAASRVLYEQMDRYRSSTRWSAPVRYAAMVALALSLIGFGTWGVAAQIEASKAALAVCTAKIEAWRARNPVLAKSHMSRVDACVDLRMLTGDQP